MKYTFLLFSSFIFSIAEAQLKYIIEDFEGLSTGVNELKKDGLFTFGSASYLVDNSLTTKKGYSGHMAFKVMWNYSQPFGGWGKGIGMYVDLEPQNDYLNFYVYHPIGNKKQQELKIILEDDDNNNDRFDNQNDDSWQYNLIVNPIDEWQLVSIPLYKFKDGNIGGDGVFNINHKGGKLLTFIISFLNSESIKADNQWHFDFVCFSKGLLPHEKNIFNPPKASEKDYCLLGAWSEEGNTGNYSLIPERVEKYFNKTSEQKLDVVHFFQPFSVSGGYLKSNFLSTTELNELIEGNYIPMITFENRFVNVGENYRQPNLKNILDGHFDYLFSKWAHSIRETKGTVLVRILHEFNGDWYPWCIANNEKNYKTYIQTFRHIHTIFQKEGALNAKFIWCPNSISKPQEAWNNILDAYPGNDFVDFVGLDVYNGAGEEHTPLWRSFRKEAILNYYLLTTEYPTKALFICETASRERNLHEKGIMQSKAEWIAQFSEALQTDFNKVRLIVWFNEKEHFKINSSEDSKEYFQKCIWDKEYFKQKKCP